MKKIMMTLAALALSAGLANAQTVRLGTEAAYPPYNFINDSGEVDGFDRDVGDEVCKRAELTCEWVVNDWDSIIPNLVSGNYDAIVAGMSITEERDQVIDFTVNYTQPDPSAYMALSMDVDLNTAIIAAQSSSVQASHVASTSATLIEFATSEEAIKAVSSGEADAVLSDMAYLSSFVEADSAFMLLDKLEILDSGVGMGVRESDAELKAKLNAAIQSMKDDGTLNEMIAKWEIGSSF